MAVIGTDADAAEIADLRIALDIGLAGGGLADLGPGAAAQPGDELGAPALVIDLDLTSPRRDPRWPTPPPRS